MKLPAVLMVCGQAGSCDKIKELKCQVHETTRKMGWGLVCGNTIEGLLRGVEEYFRT